MIARSSGGGRLLRTGLRENGVDPLEYGAMPSNLEMHLTEILAKGGEQRVALLRYCVMSITMEPVFVFLAQEYRLRPTHAAALALYDVFCARDALARIGVMEALPPRNLQLQAAVES